MPQRDRVKFFAVPKRGATCTNHQQFTGAGAVDMDENQTPCTNNELFTVPGPVEAVATKSENELFAKIQFSTSLANYKKLERVKTLLSHKYPHAQLDDILEEVLDCYLKKHDPLTKPLKPNNNPSKATPAKKGRRYLIP